jgi:hypothetical protein
MSMCTSRARRALWLAFLAMLLVVGCAPTHDVPLYNLWAVNHGPEDRLLVLGSDPSGRSTQPAVLIPADGRTRSTLGSTMSGTIGAIAAVLVYDLDCALVARVEVVVGSHLLTLDGDEATLSELARVTEPAGAELAAASPTACSGEAQGRAPRGPFVEAATGLLRDQVR